MKPAPDLATLTVPLLGVPLRLRSASPALLATAEPALARWRDLPSALIAPGPPAQLELVLRKPAPGEAHLPHGKLAIAQHGPQWLAAGADMLLSADLARGQALAFVEPSLAADALRLRRDVIERLGLLLVTQRERTPLAAAAVVGRQRAVVLAASEPGMVLEPLLRACQRAGLALLATTTIYVGPRQHPLLWGHATSADLPLATHAHHAALCLVSAGHGQASRLVPLEPVAASLILAALGPPDDPAAAQTAAAFIVAGGAQRLAAGADHAGAATLVAWLAGA